MHILKITTKWVLYILPLFALINNSLAQETSVTGANYISTAVPFLSVVPDSRAGAMGNSGVATSPDHNSMFWNAAKYSFTKSEAGISASYTPWLREVIDDMSISYLSGYYSLDKNQTIAASFRYFSLGEIFFQERAEDIALKKNPYELSFDVAYSRKLGKDFSGAIAFRYIFSDISQGGYNNVSKSASAFAADLSVYHRKEYGSSHNPSVWSWGVNISNIGSKISYSDDSEKEFIPTNLRLGSAYKHQIDQNNSITVSLDMNKLLVPSSSGRSLEDTDDIQTSNKNDKSVMTGIFNSFTDASGGMSEEFKEITWSLGFEYWYHNQFAIRTGYFYENEDKGNRKFYTAGVGAKLSMFDIDFSYLIPSSQNNPLQNTLRVSISANLDLKSDRR
ncbi:type IX secretion system outer membrane channel protein PorV [Ancylomarina sp. 16SWW S1-10-2]|uniref:type IX secretion system outer membrane channel protein PorV n=1 Tax=Ancylomarina sp. 16SWW S1-10-2 TaxID=2499681 RepID=UPI0012AE96A4|nr:type IX secretion system outer membrane channel protein PorV [Ancylomarina sp. 16SWW S1-10-2]MRT91785.1 type IX secretion system outer membrane channel protein PorV [Ancylomarina sp. 16SWW S1-10-2]